jgi:hypothetical protein
MKATKNLMSALLGAAMLALPVAAAAHSYDSESNRAPVFSYEQTAANQPGIVQIHDHDDWRWRDRDDGWRHRDHDEWRWRRHDRDDAWRYRRDGSRYRTVCDHDGDDCRQVRRFNGYNYW